MGETTSDQSNLVTKEDVFSKAKVTMIHAKVNSSLFFIHVYAYEKKKYKSMALNDNRIRIWKVVLWLNAAVE